MLKEPVSRKTGTLGNHCLDITIATRARGQCTLSRVHAEARPENTAIVLEMKPGGENQTGHGMILGKAADLVTYGLLLDDGTGGKFRGKKIHDTHG